MRVEADSQENLLVQAIAYKRQIIVTYNKERLRLNPQVLFFRRSEPYILAINVEKPQRLGEQRKLGQFKLAGLTEIALTGATFVPIEGFLGIAPSEEDEIVMVAVPN